MSLPFLNDKKRVAGLIIAHRKPDEKPMDEQDDKENHGLKAAAQDILRAISDNDSKHLALALQAAFDILQSSPEDEVEPHSYEAQNAKAAMSEEE